MESLDKYQDYVIKNGKFIGNFEQMYKDFEDPWKQIENEITDEKEIFKRWCIKLKNGEKNRVVEIGSGLGSVTNFIKKQGLDILGIDISDTAVKKAQERYPKCNFMTGDILDFDIYLKFDPQIIILSEITWYVLEKLDKFLNFLREKFPKIIIIHFLTTYPNGIQKYGTDYFIDLNGILQYFNLNYLDFGEIKKEGVKTTKTFFVGTFN